MSYKKYLMYTSTENLNNLIKWRGDSEFDLAVVFYGEDLEVFEEIRKLNCKFLAKRKGFKVDNFLFLLDKFPEILKYKYILFADEDIIIDRMNIEKIFQTADELNVHWAQPSHSKNSYVPYWYFLKNKPKIEYEFVNYIEIQFFLLSKEVLKETLDHWYNFSSGFGLDCFLSLWLQKKKNKIVLIHSVEMTHGYRPAEFTFRGKKLGYKKDWVKINEFIISFFGLSGSVFDAVFPFKSYGIYTKSGETASWFWEIWLLVLKFQYFFRIHRYKVIYNHEKMKLGVCNGWLSNLYFYTKWAYFQSRLTNPLKSKIPIMPFQAQTALRKFIGKRKGLKVFEFGSGGATLFFLKNNCNVISLEYDEKWFEGVKKNIPSRYLSYVDIICQPADNIDGTCDELLYRSKSLAFSNRSFKQYASRIDNFEDSSFDIIVIHGRARIACLKHAVPKLKKGGILLLDDSYRPYYQIAGKFIPPNWTKQVISGGGPWSFFCLIKQTTIFDKP